MRELNNEEMFNINGGSAAGALGVGACVAAIVTFLAGVLKGYLDSKPCK